MAGGACASPREPGGQVGKSGLRGRASLGVGVTNPGTADTQARLWWDECGQPGKAQGLALEQGLGWSAWGDGMMG